MSSTFVKFPYQGLVEAFVWGAVGGGTAAAFLTNAIGALGALVGAP